jgi:hypothetical protein
VKKVLVGVFAFLFMACLVATIMFSVAIRYDPKTTHKFALTEKDTALEVISPIFSDPKQKEVYATVSATGSDSTNTNLRGVVVPRQDLDAFLEGYSYKKVDITSGKSAKISTVSGSKNVDFAESSDLWVLDQTGKKNVAFSWNTTQKGNWSMLFTKSKNAADWEVDLMWKDNSFAENIPFYRGLTIVFAILLIAMAFFIALSDLNKIPTRHNRSKRVDKKVSEKVSEKEDNA